MTKILRNKGDSRGVGFMQRFSIIIIWIMLIALYAVMMPDTFSSWLLVTTMLSS